MKCLKTNKSLFINIIHYFVQCTIRTKWRYCAYIPLSLPEHNETHLLVNCVMW